MTRNGLQKVGIFFDEFDNSILIFAHLEEVALFFHEFNRSTAVGAFAVNELRLGPKGFARGTIPTLVFALVYVALLVEFVENLLHCLLVIFVGGADKFVVRDVEEFPKVLEFSNDFVYIFFYRDACGLSNLLNFLSVLVGTRQIKDVHALHSFETSDCVANDSRVTSADVPLAAWIIDWCGNIKFFCHIALL